MFTTLASGATDPASRAPRGGIGEAVDDSAIREDARLPALAVRHAGEHLVEDAAQVEDLRHDAVTGSARASRAL